MELVTLCKIKCLVLLTLFGNVAAYELLEFISVPNANKDQNIYLTDSTTRVTLDATAIWTRYIYFLGTQELTTHDVNFECKTTKRAKKLTKIQLCCRKDTNKLQTCNMALSEINEGSITCDNLVIRYTNNPFSGASFNISFKPVSDNRLPFNGVISCSLSDSDFVINSNEIEFRDASFYANQLAINPGNEISLYTSPVTPSSFPLSFSCGSFSEKMVHWPLWMSAVWDKVSPYDWGFCSVNNGTAPGGCAKVSISINVGDGVTLMDGSLYLVSERLMRDRPNIALLCRIKERKLPVITYAAAFDGGSTPRITKGFSIDEHAQDATETDQLVALSPLNLTYEFIDGSALDNFYLRALYRHPPGDNPEASWFKDSTPLLGEAAQKYSLRLPIKADRKISGRYELKVESSSSSSQLLFVFNIKVVGPPTFRNIDCVRDLYYVMQGGSHRVSCNVNAGKSEVMVGVNDHEASSPKNLKNLLASHLNIGNRPITNLNIDFKVEGNLHDGKHVVVDLKELKINQNFQLSVKARNENGQSQVSGTVHVVPKPIVSLSPALMNCDSACDQLPFAIRCTVDNDLVAEWKNKLGITVVQDWVINKMWTSDYIIDDSDLSVYFRFDTNNMSIIRVSPSAPFPQDPKESTSTSSSSSVASSESSFISTQSSSPPTLQDTMDEKTAANTKFLSVECRVRLYVENERVVFDPAQPNNLEDPSKSADRWRRSVRLLPPEFKKIYDSFYEKDGEITKTLVATRFFSTELREPAMGSLSWILAVVISVIIVLAVIILSVWLCTRDRGETYNAHQKELKMGNDPERELKEQGLIQPFFGMEGPTMRAEQGDPIDDGMQIGSDEEGERDDNMDTASFNEQASYVGQYGRPDVLTMGTKRRFLNGGSDHHTAV